jgi:hypothetical protein
MEWMLCSNTWIPGSTPERMKFETTAHFDRDWARLSESERWLFRTVVRDDFILACKRHLGDRSVGWPASLRIRSMANAPGIWEMTWSFSGPDGRATFEWIQIGSEPGIRWRRIGSHAIFGEP